MQGAPRTMWAGSLLVLTIALSACTPTLNDLIPHGYGRLSREECPSGFDNPARIACMDDQLRLGPETRDRTERNLLRWVTRRYGGTELTSAQLFDLAAQLYAPCPAPREPQPWSCQARLRIEVVPYGFFIIGEHRTVLVDFLAVPKDGNWQVTQAKVSVPGRPS